MGIDKPLGMIRNGALVVMHRDVRGLYTMATTANGGGMDPGIVWPGDVWSVQDEITIFSTDDPRRVRPWYGSMIMGQADASGLSYRRNRYYNPDSGQFTQPDPIGIAGGLNVYGYANGDPVNYSDPFGLCPEGLNTTESFLCNWIEAGFTVLGANVGMTIGGRGGSMLGLAAGGVPALATGTAGAMIGSSIGAAGGLAIGEMVTNVMFSNKSDIRQVNDVARANGITGRRRYEFGEYIEAEKAAGRGGTQNGRGDFTWSELMEKAREFLNDW
jgi:RHS repeat-associated protein